MLESCDSQHVWRMFEFARPELLAKAAHEYNPYYRDSQKTTLKNPHLWCSRMQQTTFLRLAKRCDLSRKPYLGSSRGVISGSPLVQVWAVR